MPTSEAEQRDLDAAKARVAEHQAMFFSMARDVLRMDEAALKTIGHKTIEGAIKSYVESTLKDCDKVWAAHLRKWPDERVR